MKVCFVIQRYGAEVTGGAELHCRWLAEHLARTHEVRVVTTCARDYVDWHNHYAPGEAEVGGLPVVRYPVQRPRDHEKFSALSWKVFNEPHTAEDERRWVVENGPVCPGLIESLPQMRDVDLFIFYSYRYYQSFFGLPRVASRAVLLPTAEEDPAIHMGVFGEMFRSPRGIIYLTPEEQQLVQQASGNQSVPSVVIGTGLDVPSGWQAIDARAKFDLPPRFLLYVGRIDRNKGVDELFQYYEWLEAERIDAPMLVLAGEKVAWIPENPKVRHVGRVTDEEKFALIAACDLLVMPSRYESLSIVVLEAWALGRPVLANARCKVLEGQCLRSNGGLFYEDYAEFATTLRMLVESDELRARLGAAGRAYVEREYAWPVVEGRVNSLLASLARGQV